MPTKAELRRLVMYITPEEYSMKKREESLIKAITRAKNDIITKAKYGLTISGTFTIYEDESYRNAFLNGVKAEFPDIDVSVSTDSGLITYTFSWKD